MASPFSTLPPETRDHIWDMLSDEEDYTSLLHTNSQLRSDILHRLPHRRVLCNCRLGKTASAPDEKHDCERINIDKLCVFVDSDFKRGSAMRIQATWTIDEGPERQVIRRRQSMWSIKNTRSVFAKVLKQYNPKEVVVSIQAPQGGNRRAALFVLLAKVCDAAEVVDRLGDCTGSFGIHLSETRKADDISGTPFWEDDKALLGYEDTSYPVRFYDCIMLPLLYGTSRGPYDAKVTFEHPPETRGLLFKNTPSTTDQEELDWSIVEGIMCLSYMKAGIATERSGYAPRFATKRLSGETLIFRWNDSRKNPWWGAWRKAHEIEYMLDQLNDFYIGLLNDLYESGSCRRCPAETGPPELRGLRKYITLSMPARERFTRHPKPEGDWFAPSDSYA
ncbi:hypothetical protein CKAH01_02061 [Colletotrichum kahawae]|uniref:Uncharacterized protein n=1 Tax=Colletotrichum kahawae TaxID=34407 RepID=A0AAD9Y1U0_COLKA|nr:hypothetical protein CKAH01_02061 [Colletotrichum kahawae]